MFTASFRLSVSYAQNKKTPTDFDYDYYSLALSSISSSVAEANKLSEIPARVKLLLYAAKILPASERDERTRLLEIALRDLKDWGSEEKATWYQRNTADNLRNEVLSLYAVLDPEKATALQKEFRGSPESTDDRGTTAHQNKNWFTQFRDREMIADQAAKIGLALVDTDPDKALALAVSSLQGGIFSRAIFDIAQKLIQSGNRSLLNKLEINIGQALASTVTLHWSSLSYAAAMIQSDKDMPAAARNAFVNFFMRSLQAWANLVKDPGSQLETSYISIVFTNFTLNVRPVIFQYSPDQLLSFDLVLGQVAPFVPEKTKAQLQSFEPEKFSEPRDRLADILKDPIPEKRDLRLIGFIAQRLRNDRGDLEKNLDLISDAINGFSDEDIKAVYSDFFTVTRMNVFVKQNKFIEAQQLAASISSEEMRSWALLALSTVAAKGDRVLGFGLISNALSALEKASPSPRKVELALMASAVLAKNDPERAFDTFSAASRYANSSASKVDQTRKPPVAFGLDVAIGEAHAKIGVFPESLGELEIDSSLSTLATTDWFRANQIADGVREPALRLRLKLELAKAVIAQGPKHAKKENAQAQRP